MNHISSLSGLYTALVRRLHFLVLMACFVPLFCLILTFGMPYGEAENAVSHFLPLYGMSLFIACPALLTYLLQERAKNLAFFMLCAIPVCCICMTGLFAAESALGISVQSGEQVPQTLIMLAYLLDAIRMRTNDNSRKKARVQEDHSWAGDIYLLPLPSLVILIPFVVIYIAALFLPCDELAQVCLVGAILYFFIVVPYHVIIKKEEYLEGRHHVSRIPGQLISRLLTSSLVHVLIPCALIALMAIMTSGGRRFIDMPRLPVSSAENSGDMEMYADDAFANRLFTMFDSEKGAPPPQWLISLIDFIENALTVVVAAVIICGIALGIRYVARRFIRHYADDAAGQALSFETDEHVSLRPAGRNKGSSPATGAVRRRYRRTILRFRGGPPDIYETPSMMEERAHMPDSEAMRILHNDYEEARYSHLQQPASQKGVRTIQSPAGRPALNCKLDSAENNNEKNDASYFPIISV